MACGGNMNTDTIIEQINAEISLLQQAKALLNGATVTATKRAPGRPKSVVAARILSVKPTKHVKRMISAGGKARIAEAQKARWAAKRKQEKKTANAIAKVKAAKKAAKVAAKPTVKAAKKAVKVEATPAKAENGA
jgi:hypothetical protein